MNDLIIAFSPLPIKVRKLREGAHLPARASSNAAGADLHCIDSFTLSPGERKLVPTGIAVEIPEGYYGRVAPRSGVAVRHGIDTLAGVIDSDYRGEVQILLVNLGTEEAVFQQGDRIAQLIIEHAAPAGYQWSEELGETERAAGGFGSTGKREIKGNEE